MLYRYKYTPDYVAKGSNRVGIFIPILVPIYTILLTRSIFTNIIATNTSGLLVNLTNILVIPLLIGSNLSLTNTNTNTRLKLLTDTNSGRKTYTNTNINTAYRYRVSVLANILLSFQHLGR